MEDTDIEEVQLAELGTPSVQNEQNVESCLEADEDRLEIEKLKFENMLIIRQMELEIEREKLHVEVRKAELEQETNAELEREKLQFS